MTQGGGSVLVRSLVSWVLWGFGEGFAVFMAGPISDPWRIKCLKSIWWMPRRTEAMKDVARCDKSRGAASRL